MPCPLPSCLSEGSWAFSCCLPWSPVPSRSPPSQGSLLWGLHHCKGRSWLQVHTSPCGPRGVAQPLEPWLCAWQPWVVAILNCAPPFEYVRSSTGPESPHVSCLGGPGPHLLRPLVESEVTGR